MKRTLIVVLSLLAVPAAWAARFEVERTVEIPAGRAEGSGQVSNPRISPDGKAIFFEFLSADGDLAEVYVGEVQNPGVFPPILRAVESAIPAKKKDIFALSGPGAAEQTVSEHPAWGKPTERGQTLVMAATRKDASRGAAQVSFDIYYKAPGRKSYLVEHPENDSEPVFSPAGDSFVFASGRSGEGDLYLYSFFAKADPLCRITFEEGGSELYPAWSPEGKALAFIGHLGGADHLFILDDVKALAEKKDEASRKTAARAMMRDLTAGWRHSALGPAFSPDGNWIAFFMHPKGMTRTDLYAVKRKGGEPILLMENVLAPSRGGPCWSPASDGVFVVAESAKEMNPIVWVPVQSSASRQKLATSTQLNTDLSLVAGGDSSLVLLYAAQGGGEKDKEKRWRKIFATRLLKK